MIIYNRWGQMVNYTRNLSYGWDGSINGEPASEGTYYFVVFFKDLVVVDADRQVTRGSFTLKR
jgi:gliding motility-associated-like protein